VPTRPPTQDDSCGGWSDPGVDPGAAPPPGELLLVLAAHRERAVSVEFLPDGDLVSASWDRTARIADLAAIDTPVAELAAAVVGAWGP